MFLAHMGVERLGEEPGRGGHNVGTGWVIWVQLPAGPTYRGHPPEVGGFGEDRGRPAFMVAVLGVVPLLPEEVEGGRDEEHPEVEEVISDGLVLSRDLEEVHVLDPGPRELDPEGRPGLAIAWGDSSQRGSINL